MSVITGFGFDGLYLLVFSLVFWCINEKKGLHLGIALGIFLWIHLALNVLVNQEQVIGVGIRLLAGGMLLCTCFLAGKRIEEKLAPHSPRAALVACAALAFTMNLYRPSLEMIMPAGLILGLGTGYFLCWRYIGFRASLTGTTILAKFCIIPARCILGMGIMILLYMASRTITDNFAETGNYQLFIFLRYILMALWVTAGAPWLFRIVRLYSPAGEHH